MKKSLKAKEKFKEISNNTNLITSEKTSYYQVNNYFIELSKVNVIPGHLQLYTVIVIDREGNLLDDLCLSFSTIEKAKEYIKKELK